MLLKGGKAQTSAVFSRHMVTASSLSKIARDFESEAFKA